MVPDSPIICVVRCDFTRRQFCFAGPGTSGRALDAPRDVDSWWRYWPNFSGVCETGKSRCTNVHQPHVLVVHRSHRIRRHLTGIVAYLRVSLTLRPVDRSTSLNSKGQEAHVRRIRRECAIAFANLT